MDAARSDGSRGWAVGDPHESVGLGRLEQSALASQAKVPVRRREDHSGVRQVHSNHGDQTFQSKNETFQS